MDGFADFFVKKEGGASSLQFGGPLAGPTFVGYADTECGLRPHPSFL
jgi:hypothetical protein